MRTISKSVDSAVSYLVKHPISLKGKNKDHEVSATVGGKLSKQDKDFIKSGKKFRIANKNGKNTLIEI